MCIHLISVAEVRAKESGLVVLTQEGQKYIFNKHKVRVNAKGNVCRQQKPTSKGARKSAKKLRGQIFKVLSSYLTFPETRMNSVEDFNLEEGFRNNDDMNAFKQISQRIRKLKSENINIVVYNEKMFNAVYEKLKCAYRKNYREGKGLPKRRGTEGATAEMEVMRIGDVAELGAAHGEDEQQQEGGVHGDSNRRGQLELVRVTQEKKSSRGKCSNI